MLQGTLWQFLKGLSLQIVWFVRTSPPNYSFIYICLEKSKKQVVKQYFKRLTHFCSIRLLSQMSFYNLGSENVLALGCNRTHKASTACLWVTYAAKGVLFCSSLGMRGDMLISSIHMGRRTLLVYRNIYKSILLSGYWTYRVFIQFSEKLKNFRWKGDPDDPEVTKAPWKRARNINSGECFASCIPCKGDNRKYG